MVSWHSQLRHPTGSSLRRNPLARPWSHGPVPGSQMTGSDTTANRAPGMESAITFAVSGGVIWSSSPTTTRVGIPPSSLQQRSAVRPVTHCSRGPEYPRHFGCRHHGRRTRPARAGSPRRVGAQASRQHGARDRVAPPSRACAIATSRARSCPRGVRFRSSGHENQAPNPIAGSTKQSRNAMYPPIESPHRTTSLRPEHRSMRGGLRRRSPCCSRDRAHRIVPCRAGPEQCASNPVESGDLILPDRVIERVPVNEENGWPVRRDLNAELTPFTVTGAVTRRATVDS